MTPPEWLSRLFGLGRASESVSHTGPGVNTHVIILDGTLSSLNDGDETNAGLAYKLLCGCSGVRGLTLYYEPGIQWTRWAETLGVMTGRGINRQIRRAYGVLSSRYRAGDRVILMGYSRGAYAVRSLAGVIDEVGLLTPVHATERNVQRAWRLYESEAPSARRAAFRAAHCHEGAEIEAVAVWDTVKALGLRWPILWRFTEPRHGFHSDQLGATTKHGYHALALDETRVAYAPVLWRADGWDGHVEQVWFRGAHGDVGGHLNGFGEARPLANIPLVWMLERLEACGVPLPGGWRAGYVQDVTAPAVGTWRGWAKVFLLRRSRRVGGDGSERRHESVTQQDWTPEAREPVAS